MSFELIGVGIRHAHFVPSVVALHARVADPRGWPHSPVRLSRLFFCAPAGYGLPQCVQRQIGAVNLCLGQAIQGGNQVL